METVAAVRVDVTSPVASFRNPLFTDVHLSLPFPPPSTVAGMFAACLGGWEPVDVLRFGYQYTYDSDGTDDEKRQRPVVSKSTKVRFEDNDIVTVPVHTAPRLTVWVVPQDGQTADDLLVALRAPEWPLSLGRSQDLADWRPRRSDLTPTGSAPQQASVVPAQLDGAAGRLERVPLRVSPDRHHTDWIQLRHGPGRLSDVIGDQVYTDGDGATVALLPQ